MIRLVPLLLGAVLLGAAAPPAPSAQTGLLARRDLGKPNGVAPLGPDGRVPAINLPTSALPLGTVAPAVNPPLAAAGTTQASATPIRPGTTVFASGAGAGVLPVGSGQRCEVANRTGATLLIYPPPGGAIEGAAPNAPVRLEAGVAAVFASYDGLAWTAR